MPWRCARPSAPLYRPTPTDEAVLLFDSLAPADAKPTRRRQRLADRVIRAVQAAPPPFMPAFSYGELFVLFREYYWLTKAQRLLGQQDGIDQRSFLKIITSVHPLDAQSAARLMSRLDFDRDGVLNFSEFVNASSLFVRCGAAPLARVQFLVWDASGSGRLDADAIAQITRWGLPETVRQFLLSSESLTFASVVAFLATDAGFAARGPFFQVLRTVDDFSHRNLNQIDDDAERRQAEWQRLQLLREREQAQDEDVGEEEACVVCLSRPRTAVFQPCNHQVACVVCGQALAQCPVCRARIRRLVPAADCG